MMPAGQNWETGRIWLTNDVYGKQKTVTPSMETSGKNALGAKAAMVREHHCKALS